MVRVPFPQTELRDLISDITGLDRAAVVWNKRPLSYVGSMNGKPGWWVELGISRTETKGIDEDRLSFVPTEHGGFNAASQYTYRIYTLQARVISLNVDVPAYDVLDQIRRGLRSLTGKIGLQELNMSFVDWGASIDMPKDVDNTTMTESVLEIRIAWNVTVDPGDNDGGYILTAPVTGHLST